jgi:hypothetical protein
MKNKVCAGLVATVVGGYLLRRQGMRWGATDEEVHKPLPALPGDEIVPHAQCRQGRGTCYAGSFYL